MNTQRFAIFSLRLSLGWLFFYAGIIKILNPSWSAAGYLQNAKTFSAFYDWLAQPDIVPWISLVNEWALLLLGISLLLGLFVRLSGWLGAALMLLYYFPVLAFPYIGENAFLIDEHMIYLVCLILLAEHQAGKIWGLDPWCARLPMCKKFPQIRVFFE